MFGLSWLSPTLIGALAIALLASLGGAWVTHKWDGIALAHSQAETAQAKASEAIYRASVAASIAKADADAIIQQKAASEQINALQAQLQDEQRNADVRTKSLQTLLASASKPGDTMPLGHIALAYFNCLRQQSSPCTASNHPGNP